LGAQLKAVGFVGRSDADPLEHASEESPMRIGITGHRDLTASTSRAVDAVLRDLLAVHADGLIGVTCLAAGADQLFAQAVLDLDGRLECVVLAAEDCGAEFRTRADAVTVLPFADATPEAYMAVSCAVLDRVDQLIAVWDGEPAHGFGGTADVVGEALRRGIPVTCVWPGKSERHGRSLAAQSRP
jgi:hypothetical protein